MNKPGQKIAMISSTSVDLPEHRPEVRDACLREGYFPDMMESLPARDADAIRVSLEMVDRADVYIGIFAWRYGHKPEGHDISITEMEFNRAGERGIAGETEHLLRALFRPLELHARSMTGIGRLPVASGVEIPPR